MMIRFLLNNALICVDRHQAGQTVLDFLRLEKNLCGTKEGCASGDCGACTVVVAKVESDKLVYQTLNSCITFLGSLQGRQLLTVEHLKQNDQLHPAQQVLVDHHASQCGFCTPGFVMSMFCLAKQKEQGLTPSGSARKQIETALAGNLCRCTGYRPIVDAAIELHGQFSTDQFSVSQQSVVDTLVKIETEQQPEQHSGKSESAASGFHIPHNVEQLAALLQRNPGARLLAGGTDLALLVTQELAQMDQLILLDRVTELKQISHHADRVEIGAAVTLQQCSRLFDANYPDVSSLLERFGSNQIRNQATIGGNIANASPIGDLPPILLALNANLCLQLGNRKRHVNIDEFFTGYRQTALQPAEFLRSISVPLDVSILKVYKVSKRIDDDISAVCLAIFCKGEVGDGSGEFRIDQIRIGVGGMDAIPRRALQCEEQLLGEMLTAQTVNNAAEALAKEFSPISDARASAGYRMKVAQNLLRRFFMEVTCPDIATRIGNDV